MRLLDLYNGRPCYDVRCGYMTYIMAGHVIYDVRCCYLTYIMAGDVIYDVRCCYMTYIMAGHVIYDDAKHPSYITRHPAGLELHVQGVSNKRGTFII